MEFMIPDKIRSLTDGFDCYEENIGMSGSGVLMYEDMVLKIERKSELNEKQSKMLAWLKGKLPVPEILYEEICGGTCFTLMTRIHGEMACSEANMLRPKETVEAIAEGIHMLRSVRIDDCPVKYTLADMLDDAERHISKADMTGWNGHFDTPEKQLDWLRRNKPEDDFSFAHGDYCMPNVMLAEGHVCGFIDMAQCGAADRWYDVALMQQSLRRNFGGFFGGRSYPGFSREMFLDALGIPCELDRLEFHLMLDELYF